MHMAGLPVGALIAIITFAIACMVLGVACLIAALHQRAANATVVIASGPRETLTDGVGVIAYRAFNRVLISSIGGGLLIALLGKAKSRA